MATAAANIYEQDAHQASEHAAWSAVVNTRRGIDCVRLLLVHPPRNVEKNLRVLQLNTMKSRAEMEALINNHPSLDLDVLLIQEPSMTAFRTHLNHSAWRLYRPTMENDEARFRSLIYVNRRLSTSSHRQVPCNYPDLATVKIWSADTQILIFSVYIPPVPMHTPNASVETILAAIQDTIQNTVRGSSRTTGLILSRDFNRHQPAWGGNHIQPRFIEDARIDRLLPYPRPTGLPSPRHTNLLVAKPPGEKLHHRPDCDRQTRSPRQIPYLPRQLRLGPDTCTHFHFRP